MTTVGIIPYVVMLLSFATFGGAMALFRCVGRVTPSKRLLVASIYTCAAAQILTILLSTPTSKVLPWIAVGLYALAQSTFWWSLTSHGQARPAFAFIEVAPSTLTVSGPYRFVRHPIYTSYLLSWLAGVVLAEQPWLFITVVWMAILYFRAASQEEEWYRSSPLGPAYDDYRSRAGMFMPRLRTSRRDRSVQGPPPDQPGDVRADLG